ncbi:MFS general substrate transporter [Plenodomus tracheiphilus IPT5]|uniref:MFS general substrate transporter n=1 Tax=Plenodomus tracheiphilus IPT5 TaxID=1408161 RepID=A0A6A7BMJ4_9PLEO|nr:MFS general substrate transporter [Plenodomus tracheiphilus IPT5]
MGPQENVELIPGTETMGHVGATKKALIPTPSLDPHDPLNWSRAWKLSALASQWVFTWISVTGALSIAPMFPLLGHEFGLDNNQLAFLTGITVITLGVANFIIVPLSNIYRRRAVSLVFSVLIMLTCIWQAMATSHRSLIAARALNGMVCATSESIPVQMIADVFFLHERGLWTGVYFTGYFMGAFLGPIMAGTIAAHHGWRSFFWLETGLASVAIVLIVPKLEAQAMETVVLTGRPSRAQFRPFMKPDSRWKIFIIRDTWTPIKVFFNPIILWAALMLAGPADLLLFFNISESPIFAAPPYNFGPDQVGYTNFAFAVGALFGLATAGPLSDWIAARATRRNGGIREAEMRLPALWPYMIITMLSLILGGIAYQRQWAWAHIVVWAYGFAGLSVTSVPTISVAYAIDCYKPISGEIMVVATVFKNLIAFSYSYWIFDLAHESKDGWIAPAMVIFACTMGPAAFALPLYYGLGKRLRVWTRNSNVHRMEQSI